MASVYEVVTDRIIEQLEKGVVPWRQPWTNGAPMNLTTKKPYRGLNSILLNSAPFSSPFWLTFNQAKKLGGSVRKGERGSPVVFWKFPTKEEKAIAEAKGEKLVPVVRYYTVFNVQQCDGITAPATRAELTNAERIAAAEELVAAMPNRPELVDAINAWYRPTTDTVGMPALASFTSASAYYNVLFHELTHSTGHTSRLDRAAVRAGSISFGSETYAQEELVAEMGAAMLCATTGIENTVEQSASYIDGWLKVLKSDRRMVVFAAAQAQKAADYIRGEGAADADAEE